MKEYKFKFNVGDRVVCSGETNITNAGHTSSGWEKGKEFVIREINDVSGTHKSTVYFPYKGSGVWEEHLELVNKEMKNKFKKDDIIIARYNAPYSFTCAGTVCKVKEVISDTEMMVKPFNPFEDKEIEVDQENETTSNLAVDPQYFMNYYPEKTDDIKKVEKNWGKLGQLLFKAAELIKKLLRMLMRKTVTEKEKEMMKESVKDFFKEVKKELGDEKKEEKKSKGKDEAQGDEKKSDERGEQGDSGGMEDGGAPKNGGGDGNDSAGGKSGKGKKSKAGSPQNGKDEDAGKEDLKAIEAMMEKLKKGENADEEAQILAESVIKKMQEQAQADAQAQQNSAGNQGGSNGNLTKDTAPIPGKVFCGVCNKYHTKGTHD